MSNPISPSEFIRDGAGEVEVRARAARAWPAFVVYVVMLLAIVFSQGVVVAVVLIARHGRDMPNTDDLYKELTTPGLTSLLLVLSELIMGLAAVAGAWLAGGGVRRNLGFMRPRVRWSSVAAMALAALVFLHLGRALAWWWANCINPGEQMGLGPVVKQLTPGGTAGFWMLMWIGPAIFEELFFRGYLQRRLLARWSSGAAIVVSTLLFSIMHLPISWTLLVIPLGFWFGIVAWRTASLWPTMVAHAFVNGYWTLWPLAHNAGWLPEDRPWFFTGVEVAIGAVALVWSLKAFHGLPRDASVYEAPSTVPSAPVEPVAFAPAGEALSSVSR